MRLQRSGLPLLLLAGITLAAAALVVLLVANPFADEPVPVPEVNETPMTPAQNEPAPEPTVAEQPAPEPAVSSPPATTVSPAAAKPAAEPSPPADQMSIPASTYHVRTGDSLYDLAGQLWGDPFLWPLILAANSATITDPDYLRPGQRIDVPEWVTLESGLTDAERARISEAHVIAYEHYASLGAKAVGLGMGQPEWWLERLGRSRLNKSVWVLYSGLRYNANLLADFSGRIHATDANEVSGFVTRYGLPPNRR